MTLCGLPGTFLQARYVGAAAALALGAALRLWNVGHDVLFRADQAGIYMIGQNAFVHRALPVTGVSSSIGMLTQPAAVLLYLPAVLLVDPVFGAYETALANIIALVLACRLGWRYFGVGPALIGTFLFAVAANAVYYSRFVWQQNLLLPFILWLMLLMIGAVRDGRVGWLAWAAPVWGLAVQLHPTSAALAALFGITWILAPDTVRRRDLLVGSLGLLTVFAPTIIWQVVSGFADLRALYRYVARPSVTDLAAVRNLIDLLALPPWMPGYDTAPALAAGWISLTAPLAGLVYLALRVSVRALRSARWTPAAAGVGSRLGRLLTWSRAPAQAGWRAEALLLAWPLAILLSQVRHHSPILPSYAIATLPAPYLAAGMLAASVSRWARNAGPGTRSRWGHYAARGSAVMVGAVLATTACAHVYATPALRQRAGRDMSLDSQKAGLTALAALAAAGRASMVQIQASYFTVDSVAYLLRNGHALGVPTQVTWEEVPVRLGSEARCLSVPEHGSTLYAVTAYKSPVRSPVEEYVARRWDASDRLSGAASGEFFRAYLFAPRLSAGLDEPDVGRSAENAEVTFGEDVVLEQVERERLRDGGTWLVLRFRIASPAAGQQETLYEFLLQFQDPEGRERREQAAMCIATPWMSGQRLYVLMPDDDLGPGAHPRLSVYAGRSAPFPQGLGRLATETVYAAPSGRYLRGAVSERLPITRCGERPAHCREGAAVLVLR